MQFKKHQVKPSIALMMQHQDLSDELSDKMGKSQRVLEGVEDIIIKHLETIKVLGQRMQTTPEEKSKASYRGIMEMTHMGYVLRRLKHLMKIVESLGHTQNYIMLDRAFEEYINDRVKEEGPTIEDIDRRMKDIQESMGLSKEQMMAMYKAQKKKSAQS